MRKILYNLVVVSLLLVFAWSCAKRDSDEKEMPQAYSELIELSRKLTFQYPDSAITMMEEAMPEALREKNQLFLNQLRSNLGIAFSVSYNFEKSDSCFYEIIHSVKEKGNEMTHANAYINMGINQSKQAHYREALRLYEKANVLGEELEEPEQILKRTLNNIGLAYGALGITDSAMICYQEAIKLEEESNNKLGVARGLQNMGNLYANLNENSQAADYYLRATKLYEEVENYVGAMDAEQNRGVMLNRMGEYDEAIRLYTDLEKKAKAHGMERMFASVYNNLGYSYSKKGDSAKSLEVLLKSLAIKEANKDTVGMIVTYNSLAAINERMGRYAEGENYARLALTYLERTVNLQVRSEVLQNLTVFAIHADRSKEAISYLKEQNELRDSIFTKEKMAAIHELNLKYETEKKEQELQLAQQTIKTHRQYHLFLLTISLITVALLVMFHVFRRKQRLTQQELLRKSEAAARAKLKMMEHFRVVEPLSLKTIAEERENGNGNGNGDSEDVSNGNSLTAEKVEAIVALIDEQFKKHKIYLEKDLSVGALAEKIGTNRTYVSNVLNQALDTNFSSLLSLYRIEEAKNLLSKQVNGDSTNLNLDMIADKCGFNSVSSFHNNFKRETGMTPGQFRKSLQKSAEKNKR